MSHSETINITHKTVGIDVSQDWIDIHIYPDSHKRQFENTQKGLLEAALWVKTYSPSKIICENTGGLERLTQKIFRQNGLECYAVNPHRISAFRIAYGMHAKTDLLDAELIAVFADKMTVHQPLILSDTEESLKELNTRRRQLVDMQVQERNRMKRTTHDLSVKSIHKLLALLEEERNEIEKEILSLIKQDINLNEKYTILTSVPGIGDIVALTLICELPELGTLTDKQVGSLAGLAPHNKDSGVKVGRSSIRGGRKCVRTAVYMAALSAKKHNLFIKRFYDGLVSRGKVKKVALIASMRKLLILCNRLVHDKRSFTFHEQSSPSIKILPLAP
jgi:transposase